MKLENMHLQWHQASYVALRILLEGAEKASSYRYVKLGIYWAWEIKEEQWTLSWLWQESDWRNLPCGHDGTEDDMEMTVEETKE